MLSINKTCLPCNIVDMTKYIANRLLFALAVGSLAHFFPGVTINSLGVAIVLGIILSILDWTVKPILVLFTLPITLFTFGLWLFIINTIVLLMASAMISGFDIDSFGDALLFSFAISIINALLDFLFDT